jgi:hypothetical protein
MIGVLVGVLRAGVLLAIGRSISPMSDADVRFLTGYVAAFAGAGGVVGLCWPWIQRTLVRHGAFYAAGMVFVLMLLRAEGVPVMEGGAVSAMLIAVFGVIAGLFGVYYFEREFPRQAGVDPTARASKSKSKAS